MSDPSDLTTLGRLKGWLGVGSTVDDALLAGLVTASSNFIEQWLGRPVLETDVTETRDGTGGRTLALGVTPAASIANLTIDGKTIPPAMDVRTPGYLFNATRLALVGYRFTGGLGNVVIAYQAGYAVVPAAIEQACIALAGLRYRERDRIGLSSKGLAGETTQFSLVAMPADVAAMLQPFRRVAPL